MNNNGYNTSSSHGHRIRLLVIMLMVSVILMLLSAGCATVGRDFPAYKVPDIQIGKTTKDEIRGMFGSPWRVGIEDGLDIWTYGKYKYGISGEEDAQDLVIRFDNHDVVTSYSYSTTSHNE